MLAPPPSLWPSERASPFPYCLCLAGCLTPCCPPARARPSGAYEEVAEGDFLEVVTQAERVVCHFFHRDFERCRIMDKHLGPLARKHFDTRFIKLSAPVGVGAACRQGWVNGRMGGQKSSRSALRGLWRGWVAHGCERVEGRLVECGWYAGISSLGMGYGLR